MPYCPATARPETPRPPPTRRPGPQFNDDQLKWGRLDFIKLADLEQVQAFVQAGTDYAERTDTASECWSRTASVDSILCPSALLGWPGRHQHAPAHLLAALAMPSPAPPVEPDVDRPACPPILPAADCFERVMGETRKGTVRRVLEVPLWAARRTLASIDG